MAKAIASLWVKELDGIKRYNKHELKLNRTEMSMIRRMCVVELNERKKSKELRELLGLEPISLTKRVGRDGLYMLNEKMIITGSNVVGIRQRGCPKRSGGIVLRMTWKV